jgi:hypothetical protein
MCEVIFGFCEEKTIIILLRMDMTSKVNSIKSERGLS